MVCSGQSIYKGLRKGLVPAAVATKDAAGALSIGAPPSPPIGDAAASAPAAPAPGSTAPSAGVAAFASAVVAGIHHASHLYPYLYPS